MKNSHKGFVSFVVAAIVAILAVGGGVYFYTQTSSTAPVRSEDRDVAEKPSLKVSSPTESYLRMKAEFDGVETFEELDAFMKKYGSKAQVAGLDASRAQVMAMSVQQRDGLVTLARAVSPSSKEITVTAEKMNGTTATLNISSTRPGVTAVVTLVLEDGQWKLEQESWKQAR
jgi:hypothetical protein